MTREERPSSASSHTAAPQDRAATEVWSERITWDLCSVPWAIKDIHQNPRASNWLLKRLQTSKYANSLIQHLSTYLKLDSFLSAFMSGSQDKEGTQQIFPGLKSTATSARPRQQPSSNSCSSFPSPVSQGARATKFTALVIPCWSWWHLPASLALSPCFYPCF